LRPQPDRGAQIGIGCADDETLRIACVERVDGAEHPVTILRADLQKIESLVAGGPAGETPFILEPLHFGLLDQKADPDSPIGPRAAAKRGRRSKSNRSGQDMAA
jgi:hypothetical protein